MTLIWLQYCVSGTHVKSLPVLSTTTILQQEVSLKIIYADETFCHYFIIESQILSSP